MGDLDARDGSSAERYPKRARRQAAKARSMDYDDFDYGEEEELMETGFEKKKLLFTHAYDIAELLNAPEFEHGDILRVVHNREEYDVDQMRREGYTTPTLFKIPPADLKLRVPDPQTFTVDSVLALVGGERKIEVVEVKTQSGKSMRLDEFISYYKSSEEERAERGLYNVLSLEFTLTQMEVEVQCPFFVHQIDWIGNVWPRELVERQRRRETLERQPDFSTYPKVQRYCLMSVRDCFTDFHIDFGGTSVWYHVLRGKKVFWLIEPSKHNVKLYEDWILGGNNSRSFFGRVVEKCTRVELVQGDTFFIPSGWIHCVYTPEDSLVFGGNFLHSFSIPMIIRVAKSEDVMRVRPKYRFPLFRQMLFYVVERLVRRATGRIYLRPLHASSGQLCPSTSSAPQAPKQETEAAPHNELDRLASISPSTFDLVFKHELSGEDREGSRSEEEPEDWLTLRRSSMDEPPTAADLEGACDGHNGHAQLHWQGGLSQFYDDIPNGANGTPDENPTQYVFSKEDNKENFRPANTYNEEFVKGITDAEIDGFEMLLDFVKELLKMKTPEVGEGITRPHDLLREFEHMVMHLNRSRNHVYESISLKPRRNAVKKQIANCIYRQMQYTEAFVQMTIRRPLAPTRAADSSEDDESEEGDFLSARPSAARGQPSCPTPPEDGEPAAATPKTEESKKAAICNPAKSSKKAVVKRKSAEAKALPLPSQPSTPSTQAAVEVFDPLSEIVKLGQRPSSKSPKAAMPQGVASITRKILDEKRKLKERGEEKKLRMEETAVVEDERCAQQRQISAIPASNHSETFRRAPPVPHGAEAGAGGSPMEYRSPLEWERPAGFLSMRRIPKKRDKPQAQAPEVITICEEEEEEDEIEAAPAPLDKRVYEWRAENGGCVVACSPQREEVVEEEVVDDIEWEIEQQQLHSATNGQYSPGAGYDDKLRSPNDHYGSDMEKHLNAPTYESGGSDGMVAPLPPLLPQPPIPLMSVCLPNYPVTSSPPASHRIERGAERRDWSQNNRRSGGWTNRSDGGRYDKWGGSGRHGSGGNHPASNDRHYSSRHHSHFNHSNSDQTGPRDGGHWKGPHHRHYGNSQNFSHSHHESQPRYSQYLETPQQEGTAYSSPQQIPDTTYVGFFTRPPSQPAETGPSDDMELSDGEEKELAGGTSAGDSFSASQDGLPSQSQETGGKNMSSNRPLPETPSTLDANAADSNDDEDLDLREQF